MMDNASQVPVKRKRRLGGGGEGEEESCWLSKGQHKNTYWSPFTEWRELNDIESCKTDADLAFLCQ